MRPIDAGKCPAALDLDFTCAEPGVAHLTELIMKNNTSPALFQPLESRQLLAASLANGVLTVDGTENADHIGLDPRTTTQLRVEIGTRKQFFDLRQITKIVVNGYGGNDSIEVNKRNPIAIGVEIHGGDGNDYIKGSNASDRLYGEAGDDFIEGKGGNDIIDGGAGNDIVNESGKNRMKRVERHNKPSNSSNNVSVVDDKGGQRNRDDRVEAGDDRDKGRRDDDSGKGRRDDDDSGKGRGRGRGKDD